MVVIQTLIIMDQVVAVLVVPVQVDFGGPYGYPGGDGIQVLIAGPTTTGIGSTGASSDYGYFAGGGGGGGPRCH